MCEDYMFSILLQCIQTKMVGERVLKEASSWDYLYHGVSILFVMVLVFMCCGIDVSKGNGKAKRASQVVKMTNSNHTKCWQY